jgi:hypothetical protein
VIGGIVVGFEGYLLYNTVNKAGANSSKVVREPLLAEAMAAHRGDTFRFSIYTIFTLCFSLGFSSLQLAYFNLYIICFKIFINIYIILLNYIIS